MPRFVRVGLGDIGMPTSSGVMSTDDDRPASASLLIFSTGRRAGKLAIYSYEAT